MADVYTQQSTIDPVAQELVASIIQEELIQNSMLVPTITDYSALAQPGNDTVKIPRADSFSVSDKSGGTPADASALTFATDNIALNKHKYVQALVERIASIQSMVPVVEEYTRRMARAMALQIDQDIQDELKLASAAAPDHRILFANSPTNTATAADFVEAKRLMKVQNVPMRDGELWAGLSPKNEAQILQLSDFVDADKWVEGSRTAKSNGEIGRAYGFRIIISNVFDDDEMLFWHKSALGYATQAAANFDSDKDLPNIATRLSLDMIYGVKQLDSGKRSVLVNTTGA